MEEFKGFPGGSAVKNLSANAGDMGLIPGLKISLGRENSNSLQYSCLGNLMDRGALGGYSLQDLKRFRHDLATKQQQSLQ